MGTSTSFGGSRTALIPSWIDDPVPGAAPLPGAAPTMPGAPTPPGPQAAPAAPAPVTAPNMTGSSELRGPRTSFSHFAGTGSRSSLHRAISNYVRQATGGAGRAGRRMGASRASAAGLLGLVRDVQSQGAAQALDRFNLSALAGQPATTVFLSLLEFICPPGG